METESVAERDKTLWQEMGLTSLSKLVIRLIQVVAGILAVTFGYLQLENAPIDRFTEAFDADSPTKFGLFLFFIGWFYGATHDTEIQEMAYKLDPGEGLLGWREVLGILIFFVVFAGLFLVHEMLIVFQATLTLFIIVNVCTWREILRRAKAMIESSAEHYVKTKNNGCLAKLAIVIDYMNGPWQRRRFAVLLLLCLAQLAVAALVELGVVERLIGGFSFGGVQGAALSAYLPGVLFIVYVLISEVWMKIYRIRAFSDMRTIDYLGHYFVLGRRPRVPLPPIVVKRLFDARPRLNDNYR